MFYSFGSIFINLDHVKRITTEEAYLSPGAVGLAHVEFIDGSEQTFRVGKNFEVPAQPVQAQPGFFVLQWGYDEETKQDWVWRDPVIAWMPDSIGGLEPMTIEGCQRHDGILQPDGAVVRPHDGSYKTFDEWRAAMLREVLEGDEAP